MSSPVTALVTVLKERILSPKSRSQKAGIFAILGLLYLIAKYPNRAYGTRARPDLDAIAWHGAPILGNTLSVLWNRNQFLSLIIFFFEQTKLPVMSTTILGLGRIIGINSPEMIEHILKNNFENYEKGPVINENLRQALGNGIFNSDGALWKFHRKTASHVFSTKIYRSLIDGPFQTHTGQLISILDKAATDGTAVDLHALFLRLTLDTFAELSFGLDINSLGKEGKDEFGAAFDYAVVQTDARFMNPFWRITEKFTPGYFKMKRAIATVDSYAYNAIDGRRKETAEEARIRQGPSGREDLLDLFMKYRDENGRALNDVELRDVFISFIIAGRDTTAQALSWMYYEVMRNPVVEQNIWKEIEQVGTKPNYEMLMKDMRYTNAVFLEALRLYPPVPRNLKEAVNDDVLPNGTKVQAGDFILFSTYSIGRNTSVWGPQARDFMPERWLEGSAEAVEKGGLSNNAFPAEHVHAKLRKESQFKFSSFNAGPRICLGQTFATLEALTVINMLSSRFKFTLAPGQAPAVEKTSLTLPMKRPLLVNVTRRQ
ncbi:hypothetical protein BGX21_009286 [Mortierella sp. AD011]|nr:hypothetical protein BGX20_008811 [Mortierella sp. AD010]KAF9397074.1 hypothetical protein BGX21_009286 [Mortierella sp. AD011]